MPAWRGVRPETKQAKALNFLAQQEDKTWASTADIAEHLYGNWEYKNRNRVRAMFRALEGKKLVSPRDPQSWYLIGVPVKLSLDLLEQQVRSLELRCFSLEQNLDTVLRAQLDLTRRLEAMCSE